MIFNHADAVNVGRPLTVVAAVFRNRRHQDAVSEIAGGIRSNLHGVIATAVQRRAIVAGGAGAADTKIVNGKCEGGRDGIGRVAGIVLDDSNVAGGDVMAGRRSMSHRGENRSAADARREAEGPPAGR